jgi:hypothetical protein
MNSQTGTSIKATTKGIYDILASYTLAWVLLIAAVSVGLHAGTELVASRLGFDDPMMMWQRLGWRTRIDPIWWRLGVYGALQAGLLWTMAGPLKLAALLAERIVDAVQYAYVRVFHYMPTFKVWTGRLFTLGVTLVLVPFVLQPTLVPLRAQDGVAWAARAANLLDGQAVWGAQDSVVGLYRKLWAEPVVTPGLPRQVVAEQFVEPVEPGFDADPGAAYGPLVTHQPNGEQPLMDRWDPIIEEVAGGDPDKFAKIKAFMWVESGGRQFAVSHTGCAGLMQFCGGTAKKAPFKQVFGTGQVYTCGCASWNCRISREVQRDMERGDMSLIEARKGEFPCDITDARFHPKKAITAGGLYIDILGRSLGNNIYLMYIGYNSGPRIAQAVYERGGRNPEMTLAEIEQHLADELRPVYGASAESRARSLVRTHLPKVHSAAQRYLSKRMAKGGTAARPAL